LPSGKTCGCGCCVALCLTAMAGQLEAIGLLWLRQCDLGCRSLGVCAPGVRLGGSADGKLVEQNGAGAVSATGRRRRGRSIERERSGGWKALATKLADLPCELSSPASGRHSLCGARIATLQEALERGSARGFRSSRYGGALQQASVAAAATSCARPCFTQPFDGLPGPPWRVRILAPRQAEAQTGPVQKPGLRPLAARALACAASWSAQPPSPRRACARGLRARTVADQRHSRWPRDFGPDTPFGRNCRHRASKTAPGLAGLGGLLLGVATCGAITPVTTDYAICCASRPWLPGVRPPRFVAHVRRCMLLPVRGRSELSILDTGSRTSGRIFRIRIISRQGVSPHSGLAEVPGDDCDPWACTGAPVGLVKETPYWSRLQDPVSSARSPQLRRCAPARYGRCCLCMGHRGSPPIAYAQAGQRCLPGAGPMVAIPCRCLGQLHRLINRPQGLQGIHAPTRPQQPGPAAPPGVR